MTISKPFAPDLDKLLIEFRSKETRTKQHAYRDKNDYTQQSRITRKWYDFMIEYSLEIHFFDYFENYYK